MKRYCQSAAPSLPCKKAIVRVRLQSCRARTLLPGWSFIFAVHGTLFPQQGDVRLSGHPSGQVTGSGARTRDRRVPADLRADSQATVLPTPPFFERQMICTT
ncbi:hypothetical protein PoB_001815200 [Plakobranchus ocellatus]|uniref:Uncharacterized protein n=1 Tax=Plakobranchus ocellatus TaxID=259542 RepID=A0AAV3ZAY3_9GAST|nr:hypothetical protein PoB_001815200 [Plakobranchus ocellatus]